MDEERNATILQTINDAMWKLPEHFSVFPVESLVDDPDHYSLLAGFRMKAIEHPTDEPATLQFDIDAKGDVYLMAGEDGDHELAVTPVNILLMLYAYQAEAAKDYAFEIERLRMELDAVRNIEHEPLPHYRPSQRQFTRCRSDDDGYCTWADCPQLRDNEPRASGRHCPLDAPPAEPVQAKATIDTLLAVLREAGSYQAQGAVISAEHEGKITKEQAGAVRRLLSE